MIAARVRSTTGLVALSIATLVTVWHARDFAAPDAELANTERAAFAVMDEIAQVRAEIAALDQRIAYEEARRDDLDGESYRRLAALRVRRASLAIKIRRTHCTFKATPADDTALRSILDL